LHEDEASKWFWEGGEARASSAGSTTTTEGRTGACFADLDNSGHYDLFNGSTLEADGSPGLNRIYRNNGRGIFMDVTVASGLGDATRGKTRGVLCFDMNGSGYLDFFALSGWLGTEDEQDDPNQLFINRGGLRFEESRSGTLKKPPARSATQDGPPER
jgi:hypothetical protein